MISNLFTVVFGTKSFGWVWIQELEDEMPCSKSEEFGKFYDAIEYFFVDPSWLLIIIERRISCQELINEDANSPIINSLVIPIFIILIQHFRRQIFRRPTDRKCPLAMHLFSKPHINQLRKPLTIHHNILGLQIPKHNILRMQMNNSIQNPSNVEQSRIIVKSTIFSQPAE